MISIPKRKQNVKLFILKTINKKEMYFDRDDQN
jgi:hypothetical protein